MIRSKECFKCKVVKPLEDFYAHAQMADGRLNKCKACTKNDVAEHRLKNLDRIRAYDRERAKNEDRKKAAAAVIALWKKEDLRRVRAHSAVQRAVRKGTLTRSPCEICGDVKSVAHHEDYDKPLQVVWLCNPCHKQRHKEILQGVNASK